MLVRVGLILIGALLFSACGTSSAAAPAPLERDVRHLLTEFERYHPKPFPGRAAMRAAGAALVERLPSLNEDEAMVGLMRVVAAAGPREGHSGLWPFHSGHRRRLHAYPLGLYRFPEGVFVVVAPGRPELVGRRLVAVAGRPVEDVLELVYPLVPRDNGWSLRVHAMQYLTVPEVLHGLGVIDEVGPVTYTFAAGGVRLEPVTADAHRAAIAPFYEYDMPLGLPRSSRTFSLARKSEPIYVRKLARGRVLYVGYNHVHSYPSSIVAAIERTRARRIVVDVRYNGGGDNTTYWSLVYALKKHDRRGKVVLLTGPETFSAAKDFVGDVERELKHEVRIGEPTGGAPNQWGDWTTVTLPVSGYNVYVPTVWSERGRGPKDPRLTFSPQVRVPMTAADFFAGRDPALAAALTFS